MNPNLDVRPAAQRPGSSPYHATPVLGSVPAVAQVPATAGELVQGWLDGADFLINSPIDLFARVEATSSRVAGVRIVNPGNFSKTRAALADFLAGDVISRRGVVLNFTHTVPRGKGLASSTAEMASALAAVASLSGMRLLPAEFASYSVRHDSTDGTYFPGVAMINQLTGKLRLLLGAPPPLRFMLVDSGGAVESVGFDRAKARAVARLHEPTLRQAVSNVREGIRRGTPQLIATGATLSAKINQAVLPRPLLDPLLHGTREAGALGVNCAHTGTILGVMYDPRTTDAARLRQRVEVIAGKDAILGDHALIAGGVT